MPADPKDPVPLPARPRARTPACPICGRPPEAEHRPFCSRRCRERDLARWLNGAYRVETDEPAEGDAPKE